MYRAARPGALPLIACGDQIFSRENLFAPMMREEFAQNVQLLLLVVARLRFEAVKADYECRFINPPGQLL